jgi:hypothetical protein
MTTLLVAYSFRLSSKLLEELKKGTSSIEIKQRIDASVENYQYIDSIAVPVSDKLMYDIEDFCSR